MYMYVKCTACVLCELVYILFCFPDSSGGDGEEGKGAGDGGDRVGGRAEGAEQICVGKTQMYCVHALPFYVLQQKSPNQGSPVDPWIILSCCWMSALYMNTAGYLPRTIFA